MYQVSYYWYVRCWLVLQAACAVLLKSALHTPVHKIMICEDISVLKRLYTKCELADHNVV